MTRNAARSNGPVFTDLSCTEVENQAGYGDPSAAVLLRDSAGEDTSAVAGAVHRPDTVLELAAQLHQPHRLPAVWSVIIPFYNERRHLRRCITSLAAQTVAHRLILVDNASTDGSAEAALEAGDALGLHPVVVREPRPGKVAALQAGLREVTSKYVATCDADTVYPAAYLATGERLLRKPGTAAAIAATTPPESSVLRTAAAGLRMSATAALLKQQCLNGGAGQVFRTSLLNLVGGFDPLIWNLVLEDHEIIARLESVGRIAYHARFHCHPLDRENGRHTMRWRFGERVRYHLTRSADRAAFFHDFLSPRLTERGLFSDKLRRHAEQLAES